MESGRARHAGGIGRGMNHAHAWGFFGFGLCLVALPVLAPASFVVRGADGTNAQSIWLTCMGVVQVGIGVAWFGQSMMAKIADRLATFALPMLDRSPLVRWTEIQPAK